MKSGISAAKPVLRKFSFLLLMPVFLIACAPAMDHMLVQKTKPSLSTKADKAVLVVVRPSSLLGQINVFDIYIDGKMIGQTKHNSYFITDVQPGVHYVMGKAQNVAAARFNFEANRIYFLHQKVYFGQFYPRTGFTVMTYEEAMKQINEEGCDYFIYNEQHPGEDLPVKDYQETKDDFEKEVKEDPGRHKDTLEYKGYSQ